MRKRALPDDVLLSIEKPARYLGGEYNSCGKEFDEFPVRVAFCFPDIYEIGTANLGMQIIYEQFNRRNDAMCDRVYSPWFDLSKIMKERKIPLFAVETQRPVKDFDFLLITLQYEMCYTNVLEILDLSGIPIRSEDRSEDDPIVIGGGACSYNPEPTYRFFDAFYIGESETRYDEMVEVYEKLKEAHASRKEILEALADLEGIYVPAFYEVEYNDDGTIRSFRSVNPHAKDRIIKQAAIMSDRSLPYPKKPIVPFIRGMMDRATLEVMRGCIRGCRFCQAGMIYRPLRDRDPEFLKNVAIESLESTGYEELNLSSLSTSDYSGFQELTEALLPYCESHHINVGVPSLRIDSFSLSVMSRIQDIKKSSLTFAPEAGSQRMRDVINKGLTEEEILSGAAKAFSGGWSKVKLYFMLGQPTETDEDVVAIPRLADKIADTFFETVPKEKRQGRAEVQISTSFFVPKPFTPFQFASMDRSEEFLRKAHLVKDTVRTMVHQKSLSYHYHDEVQTELEGLFARGDRRVADAIEEAYRRGCTFDAWSEYLKYDVWLEVLRDTGISYDFYNYRERPADEILPWDFIDIGVTKRFLINEWEKAQKAIVTPNCREKCSGCGAAKYPGGVCYENKA